MRESSDSRLEAHSLKGYAFGLAVALEVCAYP